jgi:nicotinamide-nucleotide amidase
MAISFLGTIMLTSLQQKASCVLWGIHIGPRSSVLHATAAILSIGDELTLGQGLDTNSQWLSRRLVDFGIVPVQHATVPDDLPAIAAAILRLGGAADLLICTGGLGPTADDLTREALAQALGEPLVEDPAALVRIRAWFAGRGRPMPEGNRAQARRPASAEILPNDWGTAPGLYAALPAGGGGVDVFSLPGPPREMGPMFEARIVPRLRPARPVLTRAILSFGLGESEVAERLGELMARTHMPVVGTTVQGGVVAVRIRHEGAGGEPAIAETEGTIRGALGPYVFGSDDDSLAGVVIRDLKERAQHLAVVESCTGGMLGQMITEVPGSSAAFFGGWITYSNQMKVCEVGVPPAILEQQGAVSPQCAAAMSRGGLERSGADWCLSITGIAGPDGGSPDKPVGTVYIALAHRGDATPEIRHFRFSGERRNVREWSARAALAMLRFTLAGLKDVPLLREVRG